MRKSYKGDSVTLCEHDALVLKSAVEKLVRYGQQVGVTPEDMISLFDFGLSVPELIGFLAAQGPGVA